MKFWNSITRSFIERPRKVKAFIEEIRDVCEKYNLSICINSDGYALEIIKYDPADNFRLECADMSLNPMEYSE